ncbi:hypothetical protein FB451DRAFT_1386270 [Mycena latifolia]|nr:hypothetical protein FB451DRAFT_1386270 [Mycena latifolia]
MSSESPPPKRQRTEDAPVTRSDIWYQDGSVVLQAENTQFRVHWSILSQSSSFFRGLQGLPQPPDQPSVDGCPIVELPDRLADLEILLRALYIPSTKALPFSVIAALIRLGRKYEFRDLLGLAAERLTYENPSTFDKYMALVKSQPGVYKPTRIEAYNGIDYDVITLARENNILSVLPSAYHRALITSDRAQLFDGIPRGDGTTASLAPVDQRRYVLGRERILKQQFQQGYTLGCLRRWDYDDDCTDLSRCTRGREDIFRQLLDDGHLRTFGAFAIKNVLCFECRRHASESIAAGRKKMWEDLPGFFDLPPWNELKNDF